MPPGDVYQLAAHDHAERPCDLDQQYDLDRPAGPGSLRIGYQRDGRATAIRARRLCLEGRQVLHLLGIHLSQVERTPQPDCPQSDAWQHRLRPILTIATIGTAIDGRWCRDNYIEECSLGFGTKHAHPAPETSRTPGSPMRRRLNRPDPTQRRNYLRSGDLRCDKRVDPSATHEINFRIRVLCGKSVIKLGTSKGEAIVLRRCERR